MRLITRHKLYRAFPELDSYEDGQCEQFLAAAQGGWARWGLRWGVCAGVAGVLALVLAWLVTLVLIVPGRVPRWGGWEVIPIVVTGAMAWPLGAIVLRDVLLRWRVKRLLRVTGSCSQCGYSLIGMPLDSEHRVTCPECGTSKAVDPSLAILTKDEAGRTRIEAITQAPELQPFWTPKRWRLFKRLALAAVLVFVVLPGGLFGGYELFLRWQAREARAGRVPIERLMAIVESAQPAGAGPGTPDAWEAFDRANQIAERIDAAVRAADEFKNAQGEVVYAEYSYIYDPDQKAEGDSNEDREIAKRAALRKLEQYQADGVFDALREMAARPRAVRTPQLETSGMGSTLYGQLKPWLGQSRKLARANATRMHLALQANDQAAYLEALDQTLAIAQMAAMQGSTVDQLVGAAIEALAMRRVIETLPACDDEWLASVDRVVVSRRTSFDMARAIDLDELGVRDGMADLFTDPGRVRFGRFNSQLRRAWGLGAPRIGTFRGTMRELDNYYADLRANLQGTRTGPPRVPSGIASMAVSGWGVPVDGIRLATTAHDGLRLVIAIRRFELREKRLPESLDELVPTYLPAIPSDPLGTGPYKFRRVDPAKDRLKRSYLVYSVGLDGVDDQGIEFSGPQKGPREMPGASAGTDRVFNSDW